MMRSRSSLTMRGAFLLAASVLITLIAAVAPARADEPRLSCAVAVDLKEPIGQMRAVPVALDSAGTTALLLAHGPDSEIDPFHEMFFFPKGTLRLTLVSLKGERLWTRDLGPSVIPGIWFCPVLPFDLDGDGADEIYLVNNINADHPLSTSGQRLERLDARDGSTTGRWPWPAAPAQSMSHAYRNFLMAGQTADGTRVLVTAQGTYGAMALQGWNAGLTSRWSIEIPEKSTGARGSHMTPVVDLDGDGSDELLWGERAISIDTGQELFCGDRATWTGHSDIIQPTRRSEDGSWFIFTCRESIAGQAPRVALFDHKGERVWADIDHGHMDMGWTARVGAGGEFVAYAVRIEGKSAGPDGFERVATEEFTWDAFTGSPTKLPMAIYLTLPVDINGDGVHELAYFDRGAAHEAGTVIDREGHVLGKTGGRIALAAKILDRPGEHLVTYTPEGKVSIWIDASAHDTAEALKRYVHPFYKTNRRLSASGYNRTNLGGL